MLHEKLNVRQIEGEALRRWFADEYFELIVWLSDTDDVVSFELSYDVQDEWRAVKWTPATGCSHYHVDAGEGQGHKPQAVPTLQRDSHFSKEQMRAICERFQPETSAMDSRIASFVTQQMLRYDAYRTRW